MKEFSRPQSPAPILNKFEQETRSTFNSSSKFDRPSSASLNFRGGGRELPSPGQRPSTAGTQRVTNVAPSSSQIGVIHGTDMTTLRFTNPYENFTTVQQTEPPRVPRFVEKDKQVLRFICHFFDKDVQLTRKPLRKVTPSAPTTRYFTIYIYLENYSIEIIEDTIPNSGIGGGPFYKRGFLKKKDNTDYLPSDFAVGGIVHILGHDFHITDCDAFTREYYRYN